MPFARVLASPVIWGTVLGTFAYQYFLYFTDDLDADLLRRAPRGLSLK